MSRTYRDKNKADTAGQRQRDRSLRAVRRGRRPYRRIGRTVVRLMVAAVESDAGMDRESGRG